MRKRKQRNVEIPVHLIIEQAQNGNGGPLNRFLRLPQVIQFSGFRRTQLFQKISRGEFPKQVKLSDSGRAIAWDYSELEAWAEARKAARDCKAA